MTSNERGAFVDFVRVHVKAGDGGKGCISFARSKGIEFGGPNGGDGGRGGSVILEADPHMNTLLDFRLKPSIRAQRGQHGMGYQRSGKSGEDIVLKAPLGTVVLDADSGEEIGDLTHLGQRMVVARGGDGGRGNQHFATSTNKAPRKAEAGWPGQERNLIMELKLLADVGLCGLPNAGKSTLLATLTKATPKIAPYPFTTISPNLGVFEASTMARRITVADIPGLIEGAHSGAGLGDRFLRHIERTKVLAHLVAPEAGETAEGEPLEIDASPETLAYAWELVEAELEAYSPRLRVKPRIGVLSKVDLISPEQRDTIIAHFSRQLGIELLPISAETGEGIDHLRARLEAAALALDAPPAPPRPEPAPITPEPEPEP